MSDRASRTLHASLSIFGVYEYPLIYQTRLYRFRVCLHRQFFVPMRFVTLLDTDISWISVCRASFRQVTALIALSGYFFSTHTVLSTIKPKSYCLLLLKKRCKVVVARATYFISLKDVSFASENQRSKHCGHSRDRTCGPFLRRETLYPLSYVSLPGLAMQLTSPVSAAADKQKILNLPSRATF